jgi:hypothetical protein
MSSPSIVVLHVAVNNGNAEMSPLCFFAQRCYGEYMSP